MKSPRSRARIPLQQWLYAYAMKVLISPRLKPLELPFPTRRIADPRRIWVPTRHGQVRCYVYRPHPDAPLAVGDVVPPVHVNIHGGGFIFTNPRADDHIVKYIAAEVGAVVVSVDYSTAPNVLYPVAEEQCFDVLTWVAGEGATAHGWDGSRISVGGGSAGAKLALNMLQLAHSNHGPSLRAAALLVPFVDATLTPDSYVSDAEKPIITPGAMKLILGAYFADAHRRSEPLASPALDTDLATALPPTLILTGELDTVKAQAATLAARLTEQGAPVTYRDFEKCDHDWIASKQTPIEVVQEALDLIAGHLRTHLAGTTSPQRTIPQGDQP
jgi:acetyl esterase